MRIVFDPAKRALTLEKRGLDFALAGQVFGERHMTRMDDRRDYGEPRFISIGSLGREVVVLGLDAARRSTTDHFDEESECPRKSVLRSKSGAILTTRHR